MGGYRRGKLSHRGLSKVHYPCEGEGKLTWSLVRVTLTIGCDIILALPFPDEHMTIPNDAVQHSRDNPDQKDNMYHLWKIGHSCPECPHTPAVSLAARLKKS